MSDVTHTPGPWREGVDGNNRIYAPDYRGDESGLIAIVFKGRANMHLIGAAPDMKDALKALMVACVKADSIGELSREVDGSLIDAARQALEKAKCWP